jgi:hybrid polyketide synthase/nonribosomal peptide synthetase ACE1
MEPCSQIYLRSLEAMNMQQVESGSGCKWFSSVYDGTPDLTELATGRYWDRNMLQPVRFMQAIQLAKQHSGPFRVVIEVGPHSALKAPTLQTLQSIHEEQDFLEEPIPYTSLLIRGVNSLESIASSMGTLSVYLGPDKVDLHGYEQSTYGNSTPEVFEGLPPYYWDHDREYWHESRYARAIRTRADSVHEILGHLSPDSTSKEMRWRHMIRPTEIPWLKGHKLQGQIIFPASAYIATALEAGLTITTSKIASFEICDLEILQALSFKSESSSREIIFSVTSINHSGQLITANFTYSAALNEEHQKLNVIATGHVRICLGDTPAFARAIRKNIPSNLIRVEAQDFYRGLERLEYQYSDDCVALSGLQRKRGAATGFIRIVTNTNLLVHPGPLDVAFQSLFLAVAAPNDGAL